MCRNTHLQRKGKGENIKVLIIKASDDKYEEIKEINKIEELETIYKKIIIDFRRKRKETNATITIYDDYIE